MSNSQILFALFLSAFTSATILPGTSDAAFAAIVWQQPHLAWYAWLFASAGNSLGGIVSFMMGRMLPEKIRHKISPRTITRLQRFGAPSLLLSWLPVAGDALPIAAGWLRLRWLPCILFLCLGKTMRYGLLLWILK